MLNKGRGGGQVVNLLAFYSDDQVWIPLKSAIICIVERK